MPLPLPQLPVVPSPSPCVLAPSSDSPSTVYAEFVRDSARPRGVPVSELLPTRMAGGTGGGGTSSGGRRE